MNIFKNVFVVGLGVAMVSLAALGQPAAPRIESIALGSEGPRLTIQSAPGTTNVIESGDDLAAERWSGVTNLVVSASPYVFVDARALVSTRRYYRVLIPGSDYVPPSTNAPAGMALIPAGWFTMGDSFQDGDPREVPTHPVNVSAFYMDRYEVTKARWDEVYQWAITNGYEFGRPGAGAGADYPVIQIPWYDMVKWCNARSEKEGLTPAYYTNDTHTATYRVGFVDIKNGWVNWQGGYRLPTEAEWEKAARGGLSGKRYPWGDTISKEMANYNGLWDYSFTPVGSFPPNGYGLYDMAGNSWEWCWDWIGPYTSEPQTDPHGPETYPNEKRNGRCIRGGAWYSLHVYLRCGYRGDNWPTASGPTFGFRCVRAAQ